MKSLKMFLGCSFIVYILIYSIKQFHTLELDVTFSDRKEIEKKIREIKEKRIRLREDSVFIPQLPWPRW